MTNDEDLRDRFRELKDESTPATPPFSLAPRNARRQVTRGSRGAWYSPNKLLTLGATFTVAVIVLLTGLMLGANTGYASAQIENQKMRFANASNARNVLEQLTDLRYDMVRVRADLAKRANSGTKIDSQSLVATSADLQRMQTTLEDIERALSNNGQFTEAASSIPAKAIPMKRALAATCAVLSIATANTDSSTVNQSRQPAIPIVEIPTAATSSADIFAGVVNVREMPGGRLLVNDGGRHQIKVLEPNLVTSKIFADSGIGAANLYGARVMPLIAYIGDSTLFPNLASTTVTVIDPSGAASRSLAMPRAGDIGYLRSSGADNIGRVIFRTYPPMIRPPGDSLRAIVSDSAPLLRADFASRRTDTIAYIARPLTHYEAMNSETGGIMSAWKPDPLRAIDEWTILSDGTIAIVRGHDYHVDWIRADGTKSSSAKLPFDWRQLSDADKERLIDSTRDQRAAAARNNTMFIDPEVRADFCLSRAGGEVPPSCARKRINFDTTGTLTTLDPTGRSRIVLPFERPPVSRVFDYYPPVRSGSVLADADNNLWILPTTSKQSKAGELVYDVVNNKGELYKRVRLPLGRMIVGFGRDGAVYMATGSLRNGFRIERGKIPLSNKAK